MPRTTTFPTSGFAKTPLKVVRKVIGWHT
ncbi:hypothetical protein LINPERPRIM_LOCUS24792 [Linum perenne]